MFERWRTTPEPDPVSDASLYRSAGQGSADAMSQLYRRHGGLVYRFSLLLSGGDESIAEEVTQEVFLAVLRDTGRFDPERGALSTWLCGIARRQVWKHFERNRRDLCVVQTEGDGDEDGNDAEAPDDDPEMVFSRREAVSAVRQAIDELPLLFKEVIVLCEFEEMNYEDAAQTLGVPVGTVRSRLHRAKVRLAQRLRSSTMCESKGSKA